MSILAATAARHHDSPGGDFRGTMTHLGGIFAARHHDSPGGTILVGIFAKVSTFCSTVTHLGPQRMSAGHHTDILPGQHIGWTPGLFIAFSIHADTIRRRTL